MKGCKKYPEHSVVVGSQTMSRFFAAVRCTCSSRRDCYDPWGMQATSKICSICGTSCFEFRWSVILLLILLSKEPLLSSLQDLIVANQSYLLLTFSKTKNVWNWPKMSHLNFNSKMNYKISAARFTRTHFVKWDFLCYFQTLCTTRVFRM